MPNFLKLNDKRAHPLRKKFLSGLVALLTASPLMADIFYISTKTGGKIGSLEFKNEDILQYDTLKKEWSILFDGSDVGLAGERIDGFYVGNDYILLSLATAAKLNIGGEKIRVRDSDIVKFNWNPDSSSGDSETKGTFELFFDGSDVSVKRDIDALTLDQDGHLVFSLNGRNKLPQAQGELFQVHKQDLVRFIGNTGPETNGYFELLFDGRKAGFNLGREEIDGVDLGGEFLYLTTSGNFNVGGVKGRNKDILRCDFPSVPIVSMPVQTCGNPQVIFNGSDIGLAKEKLQDIQVVLSIDVALSPSTVAENRPAATVVGNFATTNTDAGDTILYALATGEGDADNAAFQISGNQLRTAASFNFEAKSSYSIRVRSNVSDGRFFEKQFTITIQDANDAPTGLSLSPASVAENQAPGAVVGTLASTDPDVGDTHAYTLVAGAGDADNGAFEIVGDQLRTAAVFDFETKNSYSIRVRSTDSGSGGLTFEKVLTITVGNGPDAATDITLSPDSLAENQPSGTVVGDLTSTDSDAGDTHTYALAAGAGDKDNAAFQVSGTQLKTAAVFDFETKNSYSIRIASTDSGGRSFQKTLTVTVSDVNDRPRVTAGGILNYTENSPAAAVDPALTVTDQDSTNLAGATVSISGNFHGGQDVLQFSDQNGIAGSYDSGAGVLTLTGTATLASYQAALRDVKYANTSDKPDVAPRTVSWIVNDGAANSTAAASTITIAPVNDAPVITGQNAVSLSEDTAHAIVLTDLLVTDPDNAYPAGFTLTVGDGANYTHVGNTITPALDFSGSLTVPVVVNDGANDSASFNLTVTVAPVNDAPVITGQNAVSLSEDTARAIVLTDLLVTDPDNAYPAGFTLTVGDGANYTHVGNTITPTANFTGSLTVPVVVNDGANDSASFNLTVTVAPVNDAPVITGQNAVSLSEDTARAIVLTDLLVTDPDNAYPADFTLTVGDGANYTRTGNTITPDLNFTGSLTVPVVVNDGADNSNSFNLTATVTPVNDAPVITGLDLLNDTLAYSQGEPARVIDQGDNAGASDVDSADFNTGALTVSLVNGVQAEDELGIRNQGDAAGQIGLDGANVKYGGILIGVFSGGTGGVDLVVTFNASADAAAVSALLRNITYRNSNALSPDLAERTARFVLTDGDGGTSVAAEAAITVSPNSPPVLAAGGGSPSFTEDGGAVVVDSGLTVTDANDTDLESATVTIGNLLDSGSETLAADTAGTSITASYSAPTLTLTGTDTIAHYQQVLRSVTYDDGSQNPNSTARGIDFKVNDGSIDSNTVTTTLAVVSVNDAPSLTAVDPPAVSEDAGPQTVNNWATFNAGVGESAQSVAAYTVSDVSSPGLFSSPPAVATDGTLTYTPAANASGTSTFKVVVQDNGGTANGGVDTSTAQTFTITVTAVNDAPVNTVPVAQSVNEDTDLVFSSGNGNVLSVSDIDAGANTIQVTVSALNGTITPVASGASLSGSGTASATIIGTLAQVNAALDGLKYKGNANFNATRGSETLTLVTNDQGNTGSGGALSDADTVDITVNPVNDAPAALAKDFNAQTNMKITGLTGLLTGATDPDSGDGGYSATFTVGTVSATNPAGGTISNLDTSTGSFDFDPPPGATGNVTFTYTVCDSGNPGPSACSAPAAVTVNVSGPIIWFVNPAVTGPGDGRLSNPFKFLSGNAGGSNDADDQDASGHRIFVYTGTVTGGISLNANEWMIGQGVTVDFDTLFGITPPAGTIARPSTGGTRPVVQGNVAMAASDAVRGLNIQPASGVQGLTASDATGLTVGEASVTTTNAAAVGLTNSDGAFSFTRIDATGGSSGIIWNNASPATGSFTVTGDGANTSVGGNGSGGAIANMSGADGTTNGIGVYLNNAANVTLRRMTINGTNQNYGIRGNLVNGFTLEYSTVGGTNGTAASLASPENYGEGAIQFGNATTNGVVGAMTFTNNSISGGRARNLSIINTAAGTTTLTVKGNTFGAMQNFTDGSASFAVEARQNSGVIINTTFGGTNAGEGNTLTSAVGDLVNFTGQQNTTMDIVMRNNTLSNNNPSNIIGGGSLTLATAGTMTFDVTGNSMRDANGSAVTLFKASALSGTPSMSGIFSSNTIGVAGVADSGSKTGNGIFVSAGGTGTMSYTIANNQIHQINGNGHIYADNTGGSYTANFTITGNTLDTPVLPTWFAGIAITNGSPGLSDTINVCAKIGGSTPDEKNTLNLSGNLGVIVGASGAGAGHTFNLPGYAGGANLTNVENFIQGNNTGSFTSSAYADAPATAAAFTGVGTGCGTP